MNSQPGQPSNLTHAIAKRLTDFYFGGNWSGVSLEEILSGVTWQQATRQVDSFHSIATLVFHINYYVAATRKFMDGGSLDADDKFSFDCPPIESNRDWESLLANTMEEARELVSLIEQLAEDRLWTNMIDEKNSVYYRALNGIVEHGHYHAGQIAMLKKLVAKEAE